jgi:Arylsulfotransferase (ASST)
VVPVTWWALVSFTRRDLLAGGAGLLVAGPVARSLSALLETVDAQAATGGNVQLFRSRPDLQPPKLTVLRRAESTARGHLFVAPSSGPGQRGAMVFDDTGELVWFHPVVKTTTVTDFKVQLFRGKPVLTWWEGKVVRGLGVGDWVVADSSYRELARFSAARGLDGDLHEFVISPQDTALVTINETVTRNLTSVGGSRHGRVVGGVVQELELPSGRLRWEWRSLDHVPVDETAIRGKPGPRFDYFHINSIDVDRDGNLLVSARNTWAAYKVHRRTGRVLWRLGGKRSDFAMGPGARFYWQHDVRHHADGIVSVFDNASSPPKEPQSRALLIALDTTRMRATLEHAYVHRPERILSHFMGNAQVLDNGDVLVGWGGSPYVTEFAPNGAIAFDARLPRGGQSYRAFRFPWVGRPAAPPSLAARGGTLYASWNGATEVASWQLLEGASASGLRQGQTVQRAGFETTLRPTAGARSAAVVALDRAGAPIGKSAVVALRSA